MCLRSQPLHGHSVSVRTVCIKQCIKLHFFLLLSLVFLFQCQQLPGHMIFANVCKYLCKNKKNLLNCFCMFIWGTGKLFWQQNCWRARDTVPLIFEIKMYFNGKKSFLTWNNVYEYSLCLDYVIFKTSYHYLCTRVCFFNNFKVWKEHFKKSLLGGQVELDVAMSTARVIPMNTGSFL